ncbi:hypothetical protein NQZ68_009206 [Dissostichus eleginoides]|nr:hypothetical protein NQZ68_009206 [Dissostichus eleginoides]
MSTETTLPSETEPMLDQISFHSHRPAEASSSRSQPIRGREKDHMPDEAVNGTLNQGMRGRGARVKQMGATDTLPYWKGEA